MAAFANAKIPPISGHRRSALTTCTLLVSSFFPQTDVSADRILPDNRDIARSTKGALTQEDKEIQRLRLHTLENSENFEQLTDGQRGMAISIFNHLTPPARQHFIALLDRSVGRNGLSALTDCDFLGGSTLDTLAKLTNSSMHPALEADRDVHLETLLKELAYPGQLDQKGRGVCGVSMIYHLYLEFPGEAARIAAAMLSIEGEAPLLTPGIRIKRPAYWTLPYAKPGQTTTEMLVMGAMMDVANKERIYCSHCDKSFDPINGEVSRGLEPEDQVFLWNSVFGTTATVNIRAESSSKEFVFEQIKQHLPELCTASLRCRPKSHTIYDEVTHALPASEPDTPDQHLVGLEESESILKGGLHVALVIYIEDGRVFFRDLYGPKPHLKAGAQRKDLDCRLEDPNIGLWSMSEEAFCNAVEGSIMLDTSVIKVAMKQGRDDLAQQNQR